MPLSILTDDEIRVLLESLTQEELEPFTTALKIALHEYSTNTQSDDSLLHQPERISVHSNTTGATTLFMPSCSQGGHGVKGKFMPRYLSLGTGEEKTRVNSRH